VIFLATADEKITSIEAKKANNLTYFTFGTTAEVTVDVQHFLNQFYNKKLFQLQHSF
jgi:hypothetical protein